MERRIYIDVIRQMLGKIPIDKTEFIKDLEWNLEDAKYKAPEENLQWIRTHTTLIEHIPTPKEDWEFEVISIFTTLTIDHLKAMYNLKINGD